jgi:hypothetical protein
VKQQESFSVQPKFEGNALDFGMVIPTPTQPKLHEMPRDIAVLQGKSPYSELVPNVDEGFTLADGKDPKRAAAIVKVIQARLAKARQERPLGYLVRHAPTEEVQTLQQLIGHLQAGLFITKFRKIFTRDEMNDDLVLVPARLGEQDDNSEYQEILPTSPP